MTKIHFALTFESAVTVCGAPIVSPMRVIKGKRAQGEFAKDSDRCTKCFRKLVAAADAEDAAASDRAIAETVDAQRLRSNELAARFARAAHGEKGVTVTERWRTDERMQTVEIRGCRMADIVEAYRAATAILVHASGNPLRAEITMFDVAGGYTMRLSHFADVGR